MAVGGTGVLVGVSVGVFVGGTGVLVGVSVGVFVGGTAVLVGVSVGVFVGGTAVLVGVSVGVAVGGTGVAVGAFLVLTNVHVTVLPASAFQAMSPRLTSIVTLGSSHVMLVSV